MKDDWGNIGSIGDTMRLEFERKFSLTESLFPQCCEGRLGEHYIGWGHNAYRLREGLREFERKLVPPMV